MGFILLWGRKKKEKSCICLFFADTGGIRKIKDVLSWQLERETVWQDLTKPITEEENFKQNPNLQTMEERCKPTTSGSVSLCLLACPSVCLHTWLSVSPSIFHSTRVRKCGIHPAAPLLLQPIFPLMLQIRDRLSCYHQQAVSNSAAPDYPENTAFHISLLCTTQGISLNSTLTSSQM